MERLYGYESTSSHSAGRPPPHFTSTFPLVAPARHGANRHGCSCEIASAFRPGQRFQRSRIAAILKGRGLASLALCVGATAPHQHPSQNRFRDGIRAGTDHHACGIVISLVAPDFSRGSQQLGRGSAKCSNSAIERLIYIEHHS